jgi:hypothetical protein
VRIQVGLMAATMMVAWLAAGAAFADDTQPNAFKSWLQKLNPVKPATPANPSTSTPATPAASTPAPTASALPYTRSQDRVKKLIAKGTVTVVCGQLPTCGASRRRHLEAECEQQEISPPP